MNSIKVANWPFQPNLPGRPSLRTFTLPRTSAGSAACAVRMSLVWTKSMSAVPRRVIALRFDVTLASGETPVGRPQKKPRPAIEWERATGPPWPLRSSNTPPSIRPTRVTNVSAVAPMPPSIGALWQSPQERPLNSGPEALQRGELRGEHVGAHRRRSGGARLQRVDGPSSASRTPPPNAGICSTTPCPPAITAVTQIVCAFSETAMPFTRKEGRAAWMRRAARTCPLD